MDKERREIIVIGATNTDISGKCLYPLVMEDSNLGKVSISLGGVAHNIALNLSLLGKNVTFITSLGSDVFGDNGRREMGLLHEPFKEKEKSPKQADVSE